MEQITENQTTCKSIIENTQGLIDKSLLLVDNNHNTSKPCNKCKKGFITELNFNSVDESVSSQKFFCSNAMCWYNETSTSIFKTNVIDVIVKGVNN